MTAEPKTIPMPPVVDRETWDSALQEHMQAEEALQQQAFATAAARRRLPMTPVTDGIA